ncbi:MAG: hypothetical protein Q7R56_01000 [Nanoarchaeota archaeon]|nr:hypothetical protein [Nanoarchaeota archaeon]
MANLVMDTTTAIVDPLRQIWLKIVEIVPSLIAAIVVLIVGAFVGVILGHAVKVLLEKLKFDEYVRKAKLTKAVGHVHIPNIVGEVVKWYIFVLFLAPAVQIAQLGALSEVLMRFAFWLPSLMAGVIIFLVGLAGIHYLYATINEHTSLKGVKSANKILSWILGIILAILSLRQIGVEVAFLENTFLIIVGAMALGIALALGIGLGLGLKKEGEEFVRGVRKHL